MFFEVVGEDRVKKMSESELLDYACHSYIHAYESDIHDPFAIYQFMDKYEAVVAAVERRVQFLESENCIDDEYYELKVLLGKIEIQKQLLEAYYVEEERKYKENHAKISPSEVKRATKEVEEYEYRLYDFNSWAFRKFPFKKPADEKKWQEQFARIRSAIDIYNFETEYAFLDAAKLYHLDYLYNLYKRVEQEDVVDYTAYLTPSIEEMEGALKSPQHPENRFKKETISVIQGKANKKYDSSRHLCVACDIILSPSGKWKSVQKFVEYTVQALFPEITNADIVVYDDEYDIPHEGYIQIGEDIYPFSAREIYSGLEHEDTKCTQRRFYMLSAQQNVIYDHVEFAGRKIEYEPICSSLVDSLRRLTGIRISYKGEVANPNKPMLLLSILQAIQEGSIAGTEIPANDRLEKLFLENWEKYSPSNEAYKPLFADTFYRMKAEGCWILIKKDGDADTANLRTKAMKMEELRENYKCAVITDDLYQLMRCKTLAVATQATIFQLTSPLCLIEEEQEMEEEEILTRRSDAKEPAILGKAIYPIEMGATAIAAHAYENRPDIERLEIPNGVEVVGNSAFSGCTNLKSVIIPPSVKEIGNAAFKNCKRLESVEMPSVESIGISAFAFCESLLKVAIPNRLKAIGNRAFYRCKSIQSVSIPGSVKELGKSSFEGCENLSDMTLSDGVPLIPDYMFKDCVLLREITIPRTVHWVGTTPFGGCGNIVRLNFAAKSKDCYVNPYTGLKNVTVSIPKECTFISNPYSMSVLKPVQIEIEEGNKIYEVENETLFNKKDKMLFYYWGHESQYVVREGTKVVGKYAFSGRKELEEVYLPSSIVAVEEKAFGNCKKLRRIYVPSKEIGKVLIKARVECEIVVKQ